MAASGSNDVDPGYTKLAFAGDQMINGAVWAQAQTLTAHTSNICIT